MENQNTEKLSKMFEVELPESDSMDDYLDMILAKIRPMSEDLSETEFWFNKRWKEIRDDLNFHESVLHIFREEGEYLISVDGNLSKGQWRDIESPNSIVIEHGARHELYDLAFMNDDFLILNKHGDQKRKGHSKYFVMGRESKVKNIEWRDAMELLFNVYRNNSRWTLYLGIVIFILAIVLILSLM